jgi:hypothetical protein
MFELKEKFIQKGVGGVYKSPPQPGADCEGKQYIKYYIIITVKQTQKQKNLEHAGDRR